MGTKNDITNPDFLRSLRKIGKEIEQSRRRMAVDLLAQRAQRRKIRRVLEELLHDD